MLYTAPSEITKVEEEFPEYQLLKNEDIPTSVMNDARIGGDDESEGHAYYRLDVRDTVNTQVRKWVWEI